ncbi:MAG: hypothetical protein DIU71_00095 [Proteobacteria bacterium]|nr:MAG: hypothetical protein DIU71_00095 [Pseudomonadota bacterium]
MRKRILLGSIAAMGLTGFAGQALAAEGLSYTYVEAGYVRTDVDSPNIDGDGFGLRGSLAVTDMVHVFATFSDQDLDGVDLESYEVGAGLNWPLQSNLDLVGTLSYVRQEIGRYDDDGFALGLGLRGRIGERFEAQGGLRHVNFDDRSDETSGVLSGRYFLTDTFALSAEVEFSDDFTTFMIGGRLNFAL